MPGQPAAPYLAALSALLRGAGYRTAMVGKWHLSLTESPGEHMKFLNNQAIRKRFSDPATYPVSRGFEEHYGIIWGVTSFFDPYSLVHNLEPVRVLPKDYYITDAFSDHAVEYVDKYTRGKEPFFLYLPLSAPHAPWLPPEETSGKTEEGARGDMVALVDWAVGEIRAQLEEQGLLDDTLIVFTSDNGPRIGLNGHASAGPWRGYKSHTWEGGHRVPMIARWPGEVPAGAVALGLAAAGR